MQSMYTDGSYLSRNQTWHLEDSAWKAEKIFQLLLKNRIECKRVVEVGCGAGGVLASLSQMSGFENSTKFEGYDVSPQAIALAKRFEGERLSYHCEDFFLREKFDEVDVLLVIDVFEHVPDYLGFLSKCQFGGKYKVYHIPLDMHVLSVVRDSFDGARSTLGHLHSFTPAIALAALRDTGHKILDVRYTDGVLGLYRSHSSLKRLAANVPRWLLSRLSVPLAARVLGGFSLLVLCE